MKWIVVSCAAAGFLFQANQEPAQPRRITFVTMAYPCFAPDGTKVVFQSNMAGNYDLYVMNLKGQLPALTKLIDSPADDITPMYSPDGTKLAFVSERDGNREVYVCNADGSNPVNLTKKEGNDIHPSWSADGKKMLFSSNRGNSNEDDFDIYEMNADGSGVKQITDGPDIDTYASSSRDGKHIITRRVLGENSEVFLLDADGKNPKNLTDSPNYDGWPNWSPDGKWIVFSSGPVADPAGKESNMRVYMMKPDGSEKKRVTSPPPGSNWIYDTQPVFSRDGKSVAFTRYKPGVYESSDIQIISVAT
jgi:TolB protein